MKKRNRQCKFTIKQEKQIIQQYNDGSSLRQLGSEWGCDPSTVSNILKAYKINARTLSEARRNTLGYTLDDNLFEHIDSPEKAYWLGVMYSDGYITKAPYTNSFGLSVASKDEEWLKKFIAFLGYGTILRYQTTGHSYKPGSAYSRVLIGNNKIVSDLEKWGVVERKTKIISCIPDISFKDDFIRGYIDGDGSLRKDYPCFQISGNYAFLQDTADYLGVSYHIDPDKSIFTLRYNRSESIYLEKRLYKNAVVYLERKYNIAKRSFISPLTLGDVR